MALEQPTFDADTAARLLRRLRAAVEAADGEAPARPSPQRGVGGRVGGDGGGALAKVPSWWVEGVLGSTATLTASPPIYGSTPSASTCPSSAPWPRRRRPTRPSGRSSRCRSAHWSARRCSRCSAPPPATRRSSSSRRSRRRPRRRRRRPSTSFWRGPSRSGGARGCAAARRRARRARSLWGGAAPRRCRRRRRDWREHARRRRRCLRAVDDGVERV